MAVIYGVFQLFGRFVISFPFAQDASFNTMGSVNSLGMFTAAIIPLFVVLVMINKRVLRGVFALALLASLLFLVIIDFSPAWWALVIGSAALMAIGAQKRDVFDNRWLIIPMLFLAIALLFNFFSIQVPTHSSRSMEVYLAQRPSWTAAWETVKESPVLGSGPGTFIYDFAKHKEAEWFNPGNFWNIKFDSAGSKMANLLATTGVSGIISFLAVIGFVVFYGIRFIFFQKKEKDSATWLTGAGMFVSFLALTGGYALYRSTISLEFLFFLLVGGIATLVSTKKKEVELKASSRVNLVTVFAFTLVFIFGLGILILGGQRYSAEMDYREGRAAWAKGDGDRAMENLEKAARTVPGNDLYWRELAQVYLQRANAETAREDASQSQKTQNIRLFISNAIASSKAASDANSANVANWSVRGFIYQSLIGRVEGVGNWALDSYRKASELEPSNPYYLTQAGVVLLKMASLSSEEQEKEEKIASAKDRFKQALKLKPNYAPARFQMAAAFQMENNPEEAIAELKEAQKTAPIDVDLAFQLGLIYYQQGNYQAARQELEKAVDINPDYANALYFLGLIYYRQGDTGEALRVINRLAELSPGNEEVQQILANLKAGKPPLEGIEEQEPPEAPVEETPPEITPEEEGATE